MDRKRYMRDIYSRYWLTAREKIYGFLEYDKNLCKYICDHVQAGGKLLEVAIGTGYPFADFLQKAGYSVHGINIAPSLIEKCRQLNPNIDCQVGEAESLNYPDNYFDGTYCFHSSWYLYDLIKAVDEMLRVTRPGGLVMFDIQNRNNRKIESIYRRNIFLNRRSVRYPLNVARVILRKGIPVWNWNCDVEQVPTYPESIYGYLKERGITNPQLQIMVRKEDESIEKSVIGSLEDFARLVFVIKK